MQEEISLLAPYAPYILVVIAFCVSYKIFVTPAELEKKLKDYVLKESHNLIIGEIKEDISEIKKSVATITTQNAEMYNKIMNLM